MDTIILKRKSGDFGFEAYGDDHNIVRIDTKLELGGTNFGVRPMQLLLMGLGGCSGIDIISILKKQRQEIKDFEIHIQSERQQNVVPALWEKIRIKFILTGNIDAEKAKKACDLSLKKYCSVAKTLELAGGNITYEIEIIGVS